jgi:exodeoxyribonuclease VII large subunit
MNRKAFSIYEVNNYIKSLIENDVILNDIYVQGEISNFKLHSSGHMYFSLKDSKGAINCVMFKSFTSSLPFLPEAGMKVFACGYISLYEKTGQYQLYVKTLEPSGKGSLYLAFQQLKEKLFDKGLFDDSNKKKLPAYPKTIGIITSPTGACVHDIISVCKRRNKNINLVLYPTLVQGHGAPSSICSAIEKFNLWGNCDLIILGRGGGSIEDLWAFNDEDVAYSIFNSKIPIISAVGHETDVTIADFVADIRAATPSAAAEIASPNLNDITANLDTLKENLNICMLNKLRNKKQNLAMLTESLCIHDLTKSINNTKATLDTLNTALSKHIMFKLTLNRDTLKNKVMLLDGVSPLSILKKGFSIVEDENGNVIKNKFELKNDQLITVKFNDGNITATVRGVD